MGSTERQQSFIIGKLSMARGCKPLQTESWVYLTLTSLAFSTLITPWNRRTDTSESPRGDDQTWRFATKSAHHFQRPERSNERRRKTPRLGIRVHPCLQHGQHALEAGVAEHQPAVGRGETHRLCMSTENEVKQSKAKTRLEATVL